MKKITAILLILVLAGFSLFAVVDNTKTEATINVKTVVDDFSAFGVSKLEVAEDSFKTTAAFQGAVGSSVDTIIAMLDLNDYVLVGHLSGINNTATPVGLTLSISDLESGTNKVVLTLSTYTQTIAASAASKFGTLKNVPIRIKEASVGAAALAPAGTYNATVTIALKTV